MPVGPFPISNKIAIITGGGSGINLSFARLTLAANCKTLICDLTLTPDAESLIASHPGLAAFYKCDVSNWKDLEAIPSQVTSAFGSDVVADIWIAGAGVFEPRWSSFLYDPEEDNYKVMKINAEHPIKLTRIAMRSLLGANKPGVILLVSSMAGQTGEYAAALYCASKHAVVGFTKSMAQADRDENVKVVCIMPGLVSTPLWTGKQGEFVREQYRYSEEHAVSSEEVAQAMRELVEEEKYPGGSLLEVSKGNLRKVWESKRAAISLEGTPEFEAFAAHTYAPVREVWNSERKGGK